MPRASATKQSPESTFFKILSNSWGVITTFLVGVGLLAAVAISYTVAITQPVHKGLFHILGLSLCIDGLILLLHLPRRASLHKKVRFNPDKLTIIIACYNGEQVVGETIRQALVHVAPYNIIVVSDASTDRTVEVAQSMGVRVHQNKRNLNKALSISGVMHMVETPYTLVLDDDTLIGDTFLPTSLLDDGYAAVAFNVMPVKTGSFLNTMQTFEYRKSMFMGKALRAPAGAVGNISGAIGMYRTKDLQTQVHLHSGQFGGEDQQRTSLVHLLSEGKGITFTDATVHTHAPATWKVFLRQRALRWNLSHPELAMLYMRIILYPPFHYLLKLEKAYHVYIWLTDPLRIVFIWAIFFRPLHPLFYIYYAIYVGFGFAVWLKTGRKDPFWVPIIFPLFSLLQGLCRLVAHFYWMKIKYIYLFKKKLHLLVTNRNLMHEYTAIAIILITIWTSAGIAFYERTHLFFEKLDPVKKTAHVLKSLNEDDIIPKLGLENPKAR